MLLRARSPRNSTGSHSMAIGNARQNTTRGLKFGLVALDERGNER